MCDNISKNPTKTKTLNIICNLFIWYPLVFINPVQQNSIKVLENTQAHHHKTATLSLLSLMLFVQL